MQNRLKIFIILIIFSLIITVISGLSIESATEPIHLVILHINDPHGKLTPYDENDTKNVGGMTRVATLIKKLKSENPNNTIVLHAGDELSRGDDVTTCFSGESNMLVIEASGFDAFTPGNGDFYSGASNLVKQTSLMKVPVVNANITYKDSGKQIFPSYIIKEINGLRIAILGLGVIREEHPSSRNLKLNDPIQVAKELLPEISGKSDIIIALTHIGLGADVLLAQKCPEIDVIVGGHTHNKLDEPMLVPRKDGDGNVVIVQAGEYTRFLGKLDIDIQKNKSDQYEVVKSDENLITIDSTIKEDEIASAIIEKYSVKLSEVLYTSSIDLPYKGSGDCPIGDFVADIVRTHFNSDVALIDRGSVQGGIKKGMVTLRDACKIHPWHNQILIYELTGEQLKDILSEKGAFVSGCDYKKSDGDIKDVKINDKKLDESKTYTLAIDEFFSADIKKLKDVSFKETDKTIDSIIINHLRSLNR